MSKKTPGLQEFGLSKGKQKAAEAIANQQFRIQSDAQRELNELGEALDELAKSFGENFTVEPGGEWLFDRKESGEIVLIYKTPTAEDIANGPTEENS